MNVTVTKTFFDVVSLYSSKTVIGIVAPSLNLISYKAILNSSSEINHSHSLHIDDNLVGKLSSSEYWYFSISKKEFKFFTSDMSLVKVSQDSGKFFATLFNGLTPLKTEIKEYSPVTYVHNYETAENAGEIIKDMSNLVDFCSKDDHRQAIQNVWCFNGGIHATNGSHGMIFHTQIPDRFKDWSLSRQDLLSISKILRLDNNAIISRVNYFNDPSNPDEVTEIKLKVSINKLNMEIDFIPTHSRPKLESLINERIKDRELKISLQDIKALKKELLFFKKNSKDDLVRLDISPSEIIISDKTLLLSRSIDLKCNNVTSCVLTFKVDYILNVVNYIIEKNFDYSYLKWKQSKKILDPVLVVSYLKGNHCSTGILMPVLVRDDLYYELGIEEYKRHWRERNI